MKESALARYLVACDGLILYTGKTALDPRSRSDRPRYIPHDVLRITKIRLFCSDFVYVHQNSETSVTELRPYPLGELTVLSQISDLDIIELEGNASDIINSTAFNALLSILQLTCVILSSLLPL